MTETKQSEYSQGRPLFFLYHSFVSRPTFESDDCQVDKQSSASSGWTQAIIDGV